MEKNLDRLFEATHYFCHRATELGRTMDDVQLNKVLWYSDALWYMARGQSITGTVYKRKPRGPVASRHNKVLADLKEFGCVKPGHASRAGGGFARVLDSIKAPSDKAFSKKQKELMDAVFDYVTTEVSTREISDQSHGEIWKLARDGEEIPMFTVFAEVLGTPTKQDIEDARKGFQ